MTNNHRFILPAVLLASVALAWGCTRPTAQTDDAKTKALETRVAKLEQEVKLGAAARDGLQQKLAAAEDRLRREEARAKTAEQERESTLTLLKVRTTERDSLQTQYEAFRKNIRELLGQADTAAAKPMPAGPTTAISLPTPPVPNGL